MDTSGEGGHQAEVGSFAGLVGQGKTKPVSGVTAICLMQCDVPPSHKVDQVVDCGLWIVGPLLFNGCAKLAGIVRNW